MQSFGIYTLANDAVYDQLVALLNSIEANVSPNIPVCVIPYNDRCDRVKQEISLRPHVSFYDNWDSIQRWEAFAQQIWQAYPKAGKNHFSKLSQTRKSMQRKHAAFDGSFDKFVFYDADSLAMKPLADVLTKLETYDFVFDDWEHAKPEPVAALKLDKIEKSGHYKAADVRPKLHCASFFAAKRGFFDHTQLSEIKQRLLEDGELEWINGISEAFLFNYMTLRGGYSQFNFTLSPDGQDRTGNCADADPFVNIDNVLYNQEGLKPIHRLHYMNYSSKDFARLSQGENVDIRYKDVFLHYRFLKQPEQKPKQLKPPSPVTQTKRLIEKAAKKIQKAIS